MSSKPIRRVVTGHDAQGRAIILEDAHLVRVFDRLGQAGLVFHEVWNTRETPARIDRASPEPPEDRLTLAPPKNGTRLRILDIPVDDPATTDLDAVFENIGGSEARRDAAGARHVSFHRTESIDYGIVLDGELTLLVDEGETTLHPGDICVQRGTNHGWVNRGTKPCRIAFILIDGKWDPEIA